MMTRRSVFGRSSSTSWRELKTRTRMRGRSQSRNSNSNKTSSTHRSISTRKTKRTSFAIQPLLTRSSQLIVAGQIHFCNVSNTSCARLHYTRVTSFSPDRFNCCFSTSHSPTLTQSQQQVITWPLDLRFSLPVSNPYVLYLLYYTRITRFYLARHFLIHPCSKPHLLGLQI
jgi:hypothetical protein